MSKTITTIAVTGGPCAGKSSFLTRIDQSLSERGYRVFVVPETATELILSGIKPYGGCMSMFDFQTFVFPKQFSKEALYRRAASIVPEDKVVIVCDRGILDNKAYVSEDEFHSLLERFDKKEIDVRDSYDAVIHLVTAADGAEHAYTLSNNAARTETPSQAREMDRKTLAAWTGHPRLRVIDNSTDFENKLTRAMSEVYSVLGEPVPLETKRQYLICRPELSELTKHVNCCVSHIMQTYLISNSPNIERRILQLGQGGDFVYYYTEKKRLPSSEQVSVEEHINEKKYLELMMDADTRFHQISKQRICFVYSSQYFELDLYPFSLDKAILSIEQTTEMEDVLLPDFLSVIREVTADPSYQNYALSVSLHL